jgi:hypothetical protein
MREAISSTFRNVTRAIADFLVGFQGDHHISSESGSDGSGLCVVVFSLIFGG